MKVLYNKILVKEVELPTQTETGLYLPDTTEKNYKRGSVVAVGNGTEDSPMKVKPQDEVLFTKFSGNEVDVEGEKYIVIEQSDVLVIL